MEVAQVEMNRERLCFLSRSKIGMIIRMIIGVGLGTRMKMVGKKKKEVLGAVLGVELKVEAE